MLQALQAVLPAAHSHVGLGSPGLGQLRPRICQLAPVQMCCKGHAGNELRARS